MKSFKLSKLRQLAESDINVFSEKIIGFKLQSFHRKWVRFQIKNRKSVILGPRGFAKSTSCNITYCLWRLIKNPNLRILIVSNTHSQAQAFLSEIKQHIENNETFKEVFPEIMPGSRWTDSEIVLSAKTSITKEANISALGAGGPIVSKHVDLLLVDDIVNEENSRTETQRKKLESWFYQTLMPTLEPDGKIHILGTRYNYHDLYGQLIQGAYGDHFLVSRAITDEGKSLWEKRFPLKKLKEMRKEYGSVHFAMQFQNDATLAKGEIFKEEWLQYYTEVPELKYMFQGVDLAISQKENADYFAMVTVGVSYDRKIYVLDAYQGRLTFKQQQEAIIRKFKEFDPVAVAIETNAYQAAQVQNLKALEPSIRVVPLHTHKDKVTRARMISPYFEDGRVHVKKGMYHLLEQLLQFPYGRHDDLFDALEFAVSRSVRGVRKVRASEPGLL